MKKNSLSKVFGVALVCIVVAPAFASFGEPVAEATISTVEITKTVDVSQMAAAQGEVVGYIPGYVYEADSTVDAHSLVALQPRAEVKNNSLDGVQSSSLDTANKAGVSTYVPDEILVQFKPGVTDIIKANLLQKHGSKLIKEFTPFRISRIRLKKGLSVEEAIKKYEADPNVEYAEPNYILHVDQTIPNDPSFSQQWGLHNTGQTGGTSDADIDAPEAWDIETGDCNVVIAVIDSGVDWNHPDLAANIWTNNDEIAGNGIDDDGNGYVDDTRGWDFVTVGPSAVYPGEDPGPTDNDPMDFHGHGTFVSGIVAAVPNNSVGIAGVSWNSKIMAVRAAYKDSSGDGSMKTSDMIAAITYAADNGADIINLSFGGYSYSESEKNAIDYACSKSAVIVAAAGNENTSSRLYPAAFDNVIAVAATDHNDDRASFSNFGSWIDVSAPGVSIYSTLFDDTYSSKSGTSFASPYVCGLTALLLSKHPEFDCQEVERRIKNTTDDIGTPGFDVYTGYGRINAEQAVDVNAWITSPAVGSIVSGTVDLIGVAASPSFSNYKVEYGLSYTPLTWTQIGNTSYTPVTNCVLATWNTTGIIDGNYAIKLTVQNGDASTFVDTKVVTVRNNAGRIVFSSTRGGNDEIYIMNADGSVQTRLTNNPAQDIYPALSPDGGKIVFTSYRDGNAEIYVMDTDGSNSIRLTNNSSYDLGPVFSPDGTKIAFFADRAGDFDIYVMNADGTNQTALTYYADWDTFPEWSPDGTKIVFSSTAIYGDRNILVMNADGTNVWPLTSNPALDNQPAWAPNGKKIAFVSTRDGNDEIYVMDADGSNQMRLTNNGAQDLFPTWSLDSSKIAFWSNRGVEGDPYASDVWVMDADGSDQITLTSVADGDFPFWGASTLDTIPPTTTISTIPITPDGNNDWFKASPSITLSRNEPATTYYQWDSTTGFWTIYSSALDAPEGEHTLNYYSIDAAGNGETLRNQLFKVDTQVPVVFDLSSPANGSSINDILPTFNWNASSDSTSGLAKYQLYIDGTLNKDGISPSSTSATPSSVLSLGSHSWYIKAVDNAGNGKQSTSTWTFNIAADYTPPVTSLSLTPSSPDGDNGWFKTVPSIALARNEPGTTYYSWTSSTGPWTTYSAPLSALEGQNTLYYYSVDSVGNTETIRSQLSKVDTQDPAVFDLSSPDNGSSDNSLPTFYWNAGSDSSSGLAKYQLYIDGTLNKDNIPPSSTSTTPSSVLSLGSHYWCISAVDNAGNAKQSISTWGINVASGWIIQAVDAPKLFSVPYPRAIAVDATNRPHIAYGGDQLYHAYFDGTQWQYETVDSSSGVGLGVSIAIDSNNKVHISYYDRINHDLQYATNAAGSWVTVTIDSTLVVGSRGVYSSIAIDSNNKVHISYFADYYLDLKYATNASGTWETFIVDSTSDVGLYNSIDIDSNNKVHISYYDLANGDLKYATNVSGSWVISTVDSTGNVGAYSSIAVDSLGRVHISYFDGNNNNLKYATNASGSWVASTVDSSGNVGGHTSIAVDSSNKVHISYKSHPSFDDLKYITNASGSWVTSTIDSTGNVGYQASIAIDSDNKMHISYFDETNDDLKYTTNASGSWVISIIDKVGQVGGGASIAIDSSNNMHVSYRDTTNQTLNYATNATGSWASYTIDTMGSYVYSDIAIDSNDKAHISYYDYTNDDSRRNLKYATDATGLWVTSTIDSIGDVGWNPSIAIDSNNNVHISYEDATNHALKYATNASGFWVTATIDSPGGMESSIAIDSNNNVHISHRDNANYDLKYTTNVSGSWVTSVIDSAGNTGLHSSIALDSVGNVYISYQDYWSYDLRLATNAPGTWSMSTIDNTGDNGYYTSIAIDEHGKVHISYMRSNLDGTSALRYATNGSGPWVTLTLDIGCLWQVGSTSIAVDSANGVHIGYNDVTNGDVKHAANSDPIWPSGSIIINSDAVYTTSPTVNLTLSASDASGVSQMRFSNDNTIWSIPEPYATAKSWALSPGDGTKTVYVRFEDSTGYWSGAYSDTIVLDTSVVTTLQTVPTAPDGANCWFKTSPTITLARNEPGTTYYSWTSATGPWTTYSAPCSAPSGQNTLYYYSVDTVGNAEVVKSQLFKVDSGLPSSVISSPTEGSRLNGATCAVNGTASDPSSSGVARVEVSLNGGAWQLATGNTSWSYSWFLSPDGSYNIKSRATDNAGNIETPGAGVDVTVDNTAPNVTSTLPAQGATGVLISTNITAAFSEDMDSATITTTTFALSDGGPVSGLVSYNAATKTATLDPTSNLAYSTNYTAIITTGAKDLTGNTLSSNNLWSFATEAAPPTIETVNPSSDLQGLSLSVTITGTYLTDASSVSFGSGITVNTFTVDSSTQITADITISDSATPGTRDVLVTTPGGIAAKTAAFTVNAAPPTLETASPGSGIQGQTLPIVIAGTHFTGATSVNFGSGIAVDNFIVDSSTRITGSITISSSATTGARDVSVTTPGGTATKTSAFTVNQNCDYLDGWVEDGDPYTACDGTRVCTYQDMVYLDYGCVGGECVPAETDWRTDLISCQSCDDGDPCTIDTCENGTCVHTPIDCDYLDGWVTDGDPYTACNGTQVCTYQDMVYLDYECVGGECVPSETDWRTDLISCQSCDDGDPCTMDTCENGTCVHTPIDCDYLDGWVTAGDPYTACNGTQVCTYQDMVYLDYECVGGECVPSETDWRTDLISCQSCDDGDPCTIDTCVNGTCVHTPIDCDYLDGWVEDGDPYAACNGTSVCTYQDMVYLDYGCVGGDCVAAETDWRTDLISCQSCDDGDPCTTDTCENGTCVHTPIGCDYLDGWVEDGAPYTVCNGISVCTYQDMVYVDYECVDGECVPAETDWRTDLISCQSCDDGDPCTIDTCENGTCVHTPIDCDYLDGWVTDGDPYTACNGTSVCTYQDMVYLDYECVDGECVPTETDWRTDLISCQSCDDGDPCTTDTCENGVCVRTSEDLDQDGYTVCQGDCNDNDSTVYPGAPELCEGKDNDCDGNTDEGVTTTWYQDNDNDNYGNATVSQQACSQPQGYVLDNSDCDDNDASEHPSQTWYKDADNDLYSDGIMDTTSCTRPAVYKVTSELTATTGDCDDNDAAVNPGATEVPYNGKDDNCDGLIDDRAHVATGTGTGTATFITSSGTIGHLTAIAESALPPEAAEDKPNIEFPHGFFSFNITGLTSGATVTVTIELPLAVPVGTQYWKYGPTSSNATNHWYQLLMGDDDGDNVITITLVDGGSGDDDLTANGIIVDQGGPGNPPTSPVGGCFIATAAYGTPMAEEIQILREFRDQYLLTNPLGQAFVDFYYKVSPPIAELITEYPGLKLIVRIGLLPAVAMSTVAINTALTEKLTVVCLLVLVSLALAVWATRRRGRALEGTRE